MQPILNETMKCEICSSINIKRSKSLYELVCMDCGNVIEYDNIDVGQINAERMLTHHQELTGLKSTSIGNLSEQNKSSTGHKLARLQQVFSQEYKNVVHVDSYYFIKKYCNQLGIEPFAMNILTVFKKAHANLPRRSRCKNIELFSLITIYRCREFFGYSVSLEDVIKLYAMGDESKVIRFKKTLSDTYGAFVGQDLRSGVQELINKTCKLLGFPNEVAILSYSLFLSNYHKLCLSNTSDIAVSCIYLGCLMVPEAGPCMLRDLELAVSKSTDKSQSIEAKSLIVSLCGSEIWNEATSNEADRWTTCRELRNRLLNNMCDSRVFAKISEVSNIINKISSTMTKLYNICNLSDRAKFILNRYRKLITETTPAIAAFLSYVIALNSLPEDEMYIKEQKNQISQIKLPELYKLCEIFDVTPSSVYKILRNAVNKILRCDPPISKMSELKSKLPMLQMIIEREYRSLKMEPEAKKSLLENTSMKKHRIYINYFREGVFISKEEYFAVNGTSFRVALSFDPAKQVLQRILVDSVEHELDKMLSIPSIEKDLNVNVYLMPLRYKVSILNTPDIEILPATCDVPSGTTLKISFRSKNPSLFIKSILINNKRIFMTNTRTDSYEETIQVNAPTIISAELSNVHIIKVSPSNHGEIIVTNKEAFSGEIITAAIKAHLGYQIQNLKIVTPIKTIMIIKDGVLFENADPSVTVQRNEKYLQKLFFKLNLHSDVKIEADFVYQKLNILVGVYLYLNRTEKFLQGSVLQASISQQINFLYNVDPKIVSLINIQGKKYSDPNEIAKICSGFSFKVKNTHSITIRVTDPTKIVPELSLGEINFDEEEDSAKISTNYNDKDELYREILVLN